MLSELAPIDWARETAVSASSHLTPPGVNMGRQIKTRQENEQDIWQDFQHFKKKIPWFFPDEFKKNSMKIILTYFPFETIFDAIEETVVEVNMHGETKYTSMIM